MDRRKALAALTLPSLAFAQSKESRIRDRFIGVWKLVSCEFRDKATGEIQYPFGTTPIGRITYDAAGRMSAQLMDPGRQKVGGSPTRALPAVIKEASCEDIRAMVTGFIAYFGTFSIDEPSRTVTHHVQSSLIPSWVGSDLRRSYEFSGADQLILTAISEQGTSRLVWQRDAA